MISEIGVGCRGQAFYVKLKRSISEKIRIFLSGTQTIYRSKKSNWPQVSLVTEKIKGSNSQLAFTGRIM